MIILINIYSLIMHPAPSFPPSLDMVCDTTDLILLIHINASTYQVVATDYLDITHTVIH